MSEETTGTSQPTVWTASQASDFSGSWTDDEGSPPPSPPYANVNISVDQQNPPNVSLTFSNYAGLGSSPYTGSFSNGEITFNTSWKVTAAETRTVGGEERKCIYVAPPPPPSNDLVSDEGEYPQTERYTKDD